MNNFARTPPRLHWVFSRSPLFFVTCCTYRRRPILARGEVHAALIDFATRAHADFGIAVGRYVILPDHIHLFVAGPDDFNLGKWVGTLKRVLGRAIAMDRSQDPIWQRGFFDHLLRSEESYAQKWDYVRGNPVRAQLVEKVEDWPHAGEFVTIYGDSSGLAALGQSEGCRVTCTASRRARRLQICLNGCAFCSWVASANGRFPDFVS